MQGSALYNPAWSPDGKKIAFQKDGKVYKVNLDGTDMQEVSADMRRTLNLGGRAHTLQDSEPWIQCVRTGCSTSPDGDWLAIAIIGSFSDQNRLYLVGPGSRVYDLQLPGWKFRVPSWSFSSAAPPRSTATSLTTPVTIKVKRMQAGSGCSATAPGPVQSLDIEKEYLPVVVASENGTAGVPLEALKAQAVASRTFALYKMQYEPRSTSFHVCDTQADQVYKPSTVVTSEVQRAVEETRGIVARWNGEVIAAFFVKGDQASGTAQFVTVNEGKKGKEVRPTTLGSSANTHNRGAMGQDKANELAAQGWDYQRILRYFYGADLELSL